MNGDYPANAAACWSWAEKRLAHRLSADGQVRLADWMRIGAHKGTPGTTALVVGPVCGPLGDTAKVSIGEAKLATDKVDSTSNGGATPVRVG